MSVAQPVDPAADADPEADQPGLSKLREAVAGRLPSPPRRSTLEELYATGDVTLHDLVDDPGEMENIGNPAYPNHDPALVERMLAKLHKLVAAEIGDDRAPFDLNLFGTREVGRRKSRA